MSTIFISHSARDNAAALAVAKWLESEGWDDYFLDITPSRGIAPGERWQEALKKANYQCEAVLFLASPDWLKSRWCTAEFLLAKQLEKRIFGVLIAPVELGDVPPEMSAEWQICDLVRGTDRTNFDVELDPVVPPTQVSFSTAGLKRLSIGLKRAGLDPSAFAWPPERDSERPPYRGLASLDAEDAAIFFGRDSALVRARAELRSLRMRGIERMLVILGASGSGKSSFLRAGMLPRLQREDDLFLPLPPIRPKDAAITGDSGLIVSLEKSFKQKREPRTRAQLAAKLGEPRGFTQLLRELRGDSPASIVISIDQGEELLSSQGSDQAARMLRMLAEVLSTGNSEGDLADRQLAIAIVTIRSDSFERLQSHPELPRVMFKPFDLRAMAPAEFKTVILGPAQRSAAAGRKLEIRPELVERLLDGSEGADALPLLAFILERLFLEYGAAGVLRAEDYDEFGGLRSCVEAAINVALANPEQNPAIPANRSECERRLRKGFIPWLAIVDPDTGQRKRSVALWDDIPLEAQPLMERLVAARMLVKDIRPRPDGTSESTLEVAHEALLRQWPALVGWLDEEAEQLQAVESVRRAAAEWKRREKNADWLVHSLERLRHVDALVSDSQYQKLIGERVADYLNACREKDAAVLADRTRARRVGRVLFCVLGMIVILVAVATVVQTRITSKQISRALMADSLRAAADGYDGRALRLAVLAARENFLYPSIPDAFPTLVKAAAESRVKAILEIPQFEECLAVSPEGNRVVVRVNKSELQLWNVPWRSLVTRMPDKYQGLYGVVFSGDGKRFMIHRDEAVEVLDAITGNLIATHVRDASTGKVLFSPDGSRFVVENGSPAGTQIWNSETGLAVTPLLPDTTLSNFSVDGSRMLMRSTNTIQLWNARDGIAIGPRIKTAEYAGSRLTEDGKAAFVLEAERVRAIDPETGKELISPIDEAGAQYGFAASPDGTVIAIADNDATDAKLWGTGLRSFGFRIRPRTLSHEGEIDELLMSPAGDRLLTDSGSIMVPNYRLWDTLTGAVVGDLTRGSTARYAASGRLVLGFGENQFEVRDAGDGAPLGAPVKFERKTKRYETSAGGETLAVSSDGVLRLYDVRLGLTPGTSLKSVQDHIYDIRFDSTGNRMFVTDSNIRLRELDASSLRLVRTYVHRGFKFDAQINRDGRRLLTEVGNSTAVLWKLDLATPVSIPLGGFEEISSASFSGNGRFVVTASGSKKKVWVWRAEDGSLQGAHEITSNSPISASLENNGQWLLVVSAEAAQVLLSVAGTTRCKPWSHDEKLREAFFSPDATRVITVSARAAKIWDTESCKEVGSGSGFNEGVIHAKLSGDGKRLLVTSGSDGHLVDVTTGARVGVQMRHLGKVEFASFSPDGSLIATFEDERIPEDQPRPSFERQPGRTVRIFDGFTGDPLRTLDPGSSPDSVAFSPNSKFIATGGVIVGAQIWHARTGRLVSRLTPGFKDRLQFSPDGRHLIGEGNNWDAVHWSVDWVSSSDPDQVIRRVCAGELRGASRITKEDVAAVQVLLGRENEDVCEVPTTWRRFRGWLGGLGEAQ